MKKRDKTISPANNDCLTKSLDRLIELYTATNKPDELKKWKAERAKYPVESNPAAKSAPMPMKKK